MKIAFLDFWKSDDESILNIFSEILILKNVEISDPNTADIIFYSVFGYENLKYNKPKIFFTGENRRRWNYNYQHDNNTIFYLTTNTHEDYPEIPVEKIKYCPHFILWKDFLNYKKNRSQKKKFCCIVVSNQDNEVGCKLRNKLFLDLSKYKKVDSAGKCFNNTGFLVSKNPKEYVEFMNEYKFMITFENSFGEGYVTEKIFNALCAGVVPIYWGDNKKAKEIFGKFPCLETDFTCLETDFHNLIKEIIQLDNDDEKYDKLNQESHFGENFFYLINKFKDINL